MPETTIHYAAGPTVGRFIASRKFYNVLCSNRGGGKTVGGLFRAIHHTHTFVPERYWPLTWAVVRDTRKNIGLTTARSIKKWWPEPYAKWRGKAEEPEQVTLFLKGKHAPFLIFDFFGVNSPGDHDRFQSYEASGGIWIEEPCPLATNTEFIASGIAETVLATAVTSLRSAPHPSVQLTLNPPSADHWVAQLWQLPGYEAAGDQEADMAPEQVRERQKIRHQSAIFFIPPRENAAEIDTPGYMERNREILLATGRQDLAARLVEGRVGYVQVGERVTPEFNAQHLAPGLQVLPRVPMILSFDYGLNPSCLAAQVSPMGYLLLHKAWTRANVGMRQLLEQDVHPWLAQQPVEQWWYCGGAEAREREQSDSEETALRMIMKVLGTAPYRAGPVSWSARRDGLHDALTRTPGGIAWVRIHPQGCALLVRALDGGWSYPTDALGRVRRDGQPNKQSKFDHLGDAMSHLCAILLRKTDRQSRAVTTPPRPLVHLPRVPLRGGVSRTGV